MVPFTALFADVEGLTEHDFAELAKDGLAPTQPSASSQVRPPLLGAIHGFVSRHGETVPFTLDTANFAPEPRRILPEQCAIGALMVASFIAPIYHLMG